MTQRLCRGALTTHEEREPAPRRPRAPPGGRRARRPAARGRRSPPPPRADRVPRAAVRLSRSSRGVSASVSEPIGTLIRNTQRQPSVSAITPPNTSPEAPPTAATPVQTATARRSPGNASTSRASAAGAVSAAPRPWTCARRHQRSGAGREPARQRRHREDAHAEREDAPAAVGVREPPGDEQAAGEHEHVRRDHPLQLALGQPEVPRDRRQRDDRGVDVEHVDELRHAQEHQDWKSRAHLFNVIDNAGDPETDRGRRRRHADDRLERVQPARSALRRVARAHPGPRAGARLHRARTRWHAGCAAAGRARSGWSATRRCPTRSTTRPPRR